MIARVFPTRTEMSPTDDLAFFGDPELFMPKGITEVHISWVFSWDEQEVQRLADEWSRIAPVKIGGPASGMRGEEFVPGMYLQHGNVITSRGCYRHCPHCSVPDREGRVRELPIHEGYNILDDNLFSCSRKHIEGVFEMLAGQKNRPMFTGGIDPAAMNKWKTDLLLKSRPKQIYTAYDTPDDYPALLKFKELISGTRLDDRHRTGCYCLIGYGEDTFKDAERRLKQIIDLGFQPYAMLYADGKGKRQEKWKPFFSSWRNCYVVGARIREHKKEQESRDGEEKKGGQ